MIDRRRLYQLMRNHPSRYRSEYFLKDGRPFVSNLEERCYRVESYLGSFCPFCHRTVWFHRLTVTYSGGQQKFEGRNHYTSAGSGRKSWFTLMMLEHMTACCEQHPCEFENQRPALIAVARAANRRLIRARLRSHPLPQYIPQRYYRGEFQERARGSVTIDPRSIPSRGPRIISPPILPFWELDRLRDKYSVIRGLVDEREVFEVLTLLRNDPAYRVTRPGMYYHSRFDQDISLHSQEALQVRIDDEDDHDRRRRLYDYYLLCGYPRDPIIEASLL